MRASAFAIAVCAAGCLFAGLAAGQAGDHPVIKPIPGAKLEKDYYQHKKFDTFTFYVKKGEDDHAERPVQGEYWELRYQFLDASGEIDESTSAVEILENYKNAAREKGGEILFEDAYQGYLTFTVPPEEGGLLWAYIEAGAGWYYLYIVQEKALQTTLKFGAAEMKKELDKSGRVAVYGINFDTDKATLKVGAETVIVEMVKLMQQNAGLKLEIQGHTDNTGTDQRNLELSKERANAVRAFMLLYGVAPDRLQANGYGPQQPVAPNDTEEGRAKNRRVELVKTN